ncbi:MAG: transposase [Mariprofundaceae bacterium]
MNTTIHTSDEIDWNLCSSPYLTSPKFVRLQRIPVHVRTNIAIQAYEAQQNSRWGVITALSREYQISRTFIYALLFIFKQAVQGVFAPKDHSLSKVNLVEAVEERILSYRMEGKSSIEGISTLLVRENSLYSSVGYISEYLTSIGESLPNTLSNHGSTTQAINYVYDEVFSKSHPILITADPISSAILKIELADQRSSDTWESHFQNITNSGFSPKLLTSDEGTGLCAARAKMFPEIPWQLDTFHGIAHRLGEWCRRLERLACKAIEAEYKSESILNSAKSDSVINKRLILSINAAEEAMQAIELYDSFRYLYHYLVHQLNIFNANGDLRQRDEVKLNMEAALELLESLEHAAINKEVSSIKGNLSDLLTYFNTAEGVIQSCQKLCPDQDALRALCLAWQWNKASIKSKKAARKANASEQRNLHLELAALFINDEQKLPELKSAIFNELDEIVQASSMVECINSILRPYLNSSKNQVNQEFLNLFMFYHNHRRYRAGKRKGRTPMEILTGHEQKEDWIALLRKEVRKKEPA